MVTIKVQARVFISEVCGRSVWAAQVLAILLALPLIAAPSARAQTFTVLHKFTGHAGGTQPPAGVVVDARGNLYGVTEFGGSFNFGTVFKLDPNGRETVLHSFLGGDGVSPAEPLIWGAHGTLYGTTLEGGSSEGGKCKHGCGAVFAADKTGKETVLYAFTGGADGGQPNATLIRDAAGNFYGTTLGGGSSAGNCQYQSCGVVFKLDKAGKETVLHTFTGGSDGAFPNGLIRDGAGNLYGTTYSGGTSGQGTVFELDKTSGKFTVLYGFAGKTDGGGPSGGLVRDGAGDLYGTTGYGGDLNCQAPYGCGTVFKMDKTGTETVLYSFAGFNDGTYPTTLISDRAGNFYGTTLSGGTEGSGSVFKLDASGSHTVLHSFRGSDGKSPNALIMDGAGNLYGTTSEGGDYSCSKGYGCGVVFKLTP
ncbi:MAG TPA: choice-of-anchor tandem repeat GloVer-containing protein [Terriglobales bacterium]|nr:choice-of-anchor tandem repeat GloVer-containing protein [Terriglobales bacterium]